MSKEFRDQVCHMGAGVTAGVVTTSVLHPLDLIKVRFQASDGVATNLPTYRNTADALRTIFVKERGRGLYQGVSPAIVGAGASWGLYFFFYERAKARYLRREQAAHPEQANPRLSTVHHLLSAWEGGSITVLFTNPVWLVKTRMQLQVNQLNAGAHAVATPGAVGAPAAALVPRRYPTMWGSFKWIVRNEGIAGLYRGLLPALFLTSHGAVQFGVYEELKRITKPYGENSAYYFVMGAMSKIVASSATYPAQVVKTRLQQDAEVTGTQRYKGVWNVITRTFRNQGVRGFYKGMAPHLYRGVLASAVTLVVYEKVVALLRDRDDDSDDDDD